MGLYAPDRPKVPLSCWFGGVAIAQRWADFAIFPLAQAPQITVLSRYLLLARLANS